MRLLLALGLAAVPAAAQFRTSQPAVRPVAPAAPVVSVGAPLSAPGLSPLLPHSPSLPSPHGWLSTVQTPLISPVNRPGYPQAVDGWLSTVQAPSISPVNRPGYPQGEVARAGESGIKETSAGTPGGKVEVTVRSGLERAAAALSPRSAAVTLNLAFDGDVARRAAAEPTSVSEGGALAAPTRLQRMPRSVDAQGKEVPPPTGLRALVRTHYLGILHDTAFKTFFSAWVTATLTPGEAGLYVSLATGLFTAPYLLLSAWAGRLADRTDKARLINRLKVVELGLAAAGAVALALGSPWGALAVVAALGTRSAVMSPAKYSLLAERVPADKLGGANGWLELSTFLSLVVGTALGGALASWGAGPLAS
ncbi:MAG: major facilitator superfamily protein, partial [Elusimicrobia bacterium]